MVNTTILESKLKRHKISYSKENEKIIIGKPRIDYITLLGLVALPIIGGIGICLLLLSNDFEIFRRHSVKVIAGIVFLFGTGFFNLSRVKSKRKANDNLKILEDRTIKIKNQNKEYAFDKRNIRFFEYLTQQVNDEIYNGKLYLVDGDDEKHSILGFDDENEKYVIDDLIWFSEYFTNYVKLENSLEK